MLFALRDALRARGLRARVYCWLHNQYGSPTDITAEEITDGLRRDGVVVYPEVVAGNPLGFRTVARWVLNYPGLLGGDATFADGELVFTWQTRYISRVPVLRLDAVDRSLFYRDDTVSRNRICTFVNKGGKFRDIPEDANAVQITKQWPPSRRELADLLRRTSCLYSFDGNSSILDEALACGAKVKVVTVDGYADYVPFDAYSRDDAERQLDEFVRVTQQSEAGRWNRRGYYPGVGQAGLKVRRRLARIACSLTHSERMRDAVDLLKQARDFVPRRGKR